MKSNENEKDFISGLKKGSAFHYRRLFEKYHFLIYSIALKMGLQALDAEEIVQETFLMLWAQRDTLDENKSVVGLIKVISKRLIIKKIQKEIRERDYQEYKKYFSRNSDASLEKEILWNEIIKEIEKGITELPDGKKEILNLVVNDGLSIKEVAEKLKISERTVESQLYQARKKLKIYLKKRGLEV